MENNKRIEGASNYYMNPNGQVFNFKSQKEMIKEVTKFKDGSEKTTVRLINDEGKRVRLDVEKIHLELFQPDLENKTKAGALPNPKNKNEPSKSICVWILFKNENKTIQQIVDLGFNEGHIRNVIRCYRASDSLQKRACAYRYESSSNKFITSV